MNNRQMSALVPYNHGGQSSQIQFGPHRQRENQQYDRRIIGQQPFIPRLYPTIPNYQPLFYPIQGFPPSTSYNQFGRPAMSTDLISFNQPNKQYQYAQFMRHIDEMQKNYWKPRAHTMPVPGRPDSFPSYNRPNKLYQYERETRYLPYPVFGQGVSGFGTSRNLGYGYPPNPGFVGGFTTTIMNVGGARNLPPKVRVIFMPQGLSAPPQPCSGALAMPPFTFNRMSQPLCSLPLPPPLPQIGSLPLSPLVQQMVMQQHSNPVAILPFTANCPPSQSMISSCLQSPPQQQFMMPPLTLPPPRPILQPSILPALFPANLPVFSADARSFPFTPDANSAGSQYSNNNFPIFCRACIPPPPPLNVPVTSHYWTQHCSACHHVFADGNKPNVRPNNGRSTPLLRHPTVIQNTYNLPIQQQLYPHTNASFATRPWAHKMPSLPRGAVIISDQYFPIPRRDNAAKTFNFSQKYAVQHPRVFISASRSVSLATTNTDPNKLNTKGLATKSQRKYQDEKSQSRSKSISMTPLSNSNASNRRRSSSSYSTSSSVSSSCSVCNASAANEQPKSDLNAHNNQHSLARKQLSAAARNINLRYNYQIPDIPAVYHNNRYLKSSDTDSTSLSHSGSSPSVSLAKEYRQDRPPSPIFLNAIQEEDEEDKRTNRSLSITSFQTSQPVTKEIVIRKLATSSPSTVSTVSVESSLDLTENDVDSISMTDTIQTDTTQTDESEEGTEKGTEEETDEETEDISETFKNM